MGYQCRAYSASELLVVEQNKDVMDFVCFLAALVSKQKHIILSLCRLSPSTSGWVDILIPFLPLSVFVFVLFFQFVL